MEGIMAKAKGFWFCVFNSIITAQDEMQIPVEIYTNYYIYEGVELSFIFAKDISALKMVEEKLIKEKNKSQKSELLKSAFLANISHEIRTPMTAIIGFSDLLTDPDLTTDQKKEIINQVKTNGEALLGLLDDIIDLSLLETNDLKLNIGQYNLNQILTSIYNFFNEHKKNYSTENVKFRLKIYDKLNSVIILTDVGRFRQIFSSLIKNAFKFTSHGFIEFGYNITQDKGLVFFVRDTGIGIAMNKQKDVFNIFTKLGDNIDKLYQGTGLGLAVTKKIIELIGGSIWFKSEPQKGSLFSFSIPVENLNISIENSTIIPKNEKNWNNKKILIVEDLDYNFELIEAALQKTNAKVIRAKDGKEAIEIYRKNESIDVILMDIRMPVMNGYDATREIKKMNCNIPIIAQTAYAFGEEKELSYRAGCDDFISKPIDKKLLLDLIEKHLSY